MKENIQSILSNINMRNPDDLTEVWNNNKLYLQCHDGSLD